MIKTKFKKDFVTLNDVLTFIKTDDQGVWSEFALEGLQQ